MTATYILADGETDQPLGSWRGVIIDKTRRTAMVSCHKCGSPRHLYPKYDIDGEGYVTPQFVCLLCHYREDIFLLGWTGHEDELAAPPVS